MKKESMNKAFLNVFIDVIDRYTYVTRDKIKIDRLAVILENVYKIDPTKPLEGWDSLIWTLKEAVEY